MIRNIIYLSVICFGCTDRVSMVTTSHVVTEKSDMNYEKITKVLLFAGDEVAFKCDTLAGMTSVSARKAHGTAKVIEAKRVIMGQTETGDWLSMSIDNAIKIIDGEGKEYEKDQFSMINEKTEIKRIYITQTVQYGFSQNSGRYYAKCRAVTGETLDNRRVTIPVRLIKSIAATPYSPGQDAVLGIIGVAALVAVVYLIISNWPPFKF